MSPSSERAVSSQRHEARHFSLLKLVNDLLDMIRIEEGQERLAEGPVELTRLLGGLVDGMSYLADSKGLLLEKQLSEDPAYVRGERRALEKIFLNLLNNAIKFTEKGGTVSVYCQPGATEVRVLVKDTGIGIPKSAQERIFDRFLMLPEMDGLDVCRSIRGDKNARAQRIMLLTARADERSKLTALENGADDFLTKPFSTVEVLTRLRNLLKNARLERDLAIGNARLERTRADLEATQAQLIQSEKLNALGSLSAGLLHEVNNPLNYSLTALQVLAADPTVQGDELMREIVSDINEGMQRIRTIVSDLRAFAYPSEADKQGAFDLNEAVVAAQRFTASELRGIEVVSNLGGRCLVVGSKSHLTQEFINLLSNAAKAIAASTDGRPGTIRVEGESRNGRLWVRVTDNGVGMDQATLARIFDPFFTIRDVGEGIRLGLSVCHTIVGNHQGRMSAASRLGEGTESVAAAELVLAAEGDGVGVLVTDRRMPGETGIALLARAKERYPTVVRLLTSAYADLESAVAAVNRGEIHRYILKPWDIEALRADLRACLRLHLDRRAERDLLAARRQTMTVLASHVAHELATPLATIATAAAGLERYLPALTEVYLRDGDHPPGTPSHVPESVLRALAIAPATVLESANRSRVLIGLLLMNAGNASAPGESVTRVSIRTLLEEALRGYALVPGERELVLVEGADFELLGSLTLLIHILYKLLKNALDAVRAAGKGEIRIGTEVGQPWNRLVLVDTGSGIPEDSMPYIFDEFFSLKVPGRGTGMGLAFCRRVMESLGGQILCRSRLGEYTRLEPRFPPVGDDGRDTNTSSENQQ